MLIDDPIVAKSNIERDDPIREKLLKDNEEPRCDSEKTDSDELKRAKPQTDKELPTRQNCLSEIEEPKAAKPNIESAEPKRPKLRTEKVEARNTKSWMESENA